MLLPLVAVEGLLLEHLSLVKFFKVIIIQTTTNKLIEETVLLVPMTSGHLRTMLLLLKGMLTELLGVGGTLRHLLVMSLPANYSLTNRHFRKCIIVAGSIHFRLSSFSWLLVDIESTEVGCHCLLQLIVLSEDCNLG
jgi:hypothetical protein